MRETPRPVYLPNCPLFEFGERESLALSLPHTPIALSERAIGGDIEADSGRRASFVVRRDELWTFSLRFHESEWPGVQHLIDVLQNGQPFRWYPDQKETTPYESQLVEPAVGGTYQTFSDPDYPNVQLLTLTVMAGVVYDEPVAQSGILKIRIRDIDSFDVGRQQTLSTTRNAVTDVGRYIEQGEWTYFLTGGREGKGYIRSVAGEGDGGHFLYVRDTAEFDPANDDAFPGKKGLHISYNLFGQAPSAPMAIQAYFAKLGASVTQPHVLLTLMPDLTVVAEVVDGSGPYARTPLRQSAAKVPLDGWWALESQMGLSPIDNDEGGFLLARLYTEAVPRGETIIEALGERTRNSGITYDLVHQVFGTQCIAGYGAGVDDVGVDDHVGYDSMGDVKRWLGNTFVGGALAAGVGDSSQSEISHVDAFANNHLHGEAQRWKNVKDVDPFVQPTSCEHAPPDDSPPEQVPFFFTNFNFPKSGFSGAWLDGVPNYDNLTVYNRLKENKLDLYRLGVLRNGIFEVLCVSVLELSNFFQVTTSGHPIPTGSYNGILTGAHRDGSNSNHVYRRVIRVGSLTSPGSRALVSPAFGGSSRPGAGRDIRELNPLTGSPFTPSELSDIQPGIQSDNSFSAETGAWNELDIQQAGLEYAYRKESFNQFEVVPYPPVAAFTAVNTSGPTYQFTDRSADWDEVIESWDWDFGDGSPHSSLQNPTHSFPPGTHTVILTVTDSDGLTDTAEFDIVVANTNPTANFSAEPDPDDEDGLTLDFEDTSTDPDVDDSIAEWDWDFGDGSPHGTTQNPNHTYAAPGEYDVVLTVTDQHGGADSVTSTFTVPEGGVTDCGLSAEALADTPYVQGDDFDGGNPPIPAHADTAAFDSYYTGVNYRGAYDSNYVSAGTNHIIDTSVLFNGHPTLRMTYGAGKFGAGWDTAPTDDGDPTEAFYTSAPFGPVSRWERRILTADAGVMSDAGAASASTGLIILSIENPNFVLDFCIRQGRIKLDVWHRATADGGAQSVDTFDLGDENMIVGRASGFGELIVKYERNLAGREIRPRVWLGDACSLVGVSPILDETLPAFIGTSGSSLTRELAVRTVSNFVPNFTPSGADKHLWVGLWEGKDGEQGSSNPYSVSLT